MLMEITRAAAAKLLDHECAAALMEQPDTRQREQSRAIKELLMLR